MELARICTARTKAIVYVDWEVENLTMSNSSVIKMDSAALLVADNIFEMLGGTLMSFGSYLISRFNKISEGLSDRAFVTFRSPRPQPFSKDEDKLFMFSSGLVRGIDKAVWGLQQILSRCSQAY